jgi:hypothetical protein
MGVRVTGQFADGLFQAALFSACSSTPSAPRPPARRRPPSRRCCCRTASSGRSPGCSSTGGGASGCCSSGNLVRAAAIVVFATLLALLGPTSPPVVALALVVVSANRFILSGLSAALPHVVEPRLLVTANSSAPRSAPGGAAGGAPRGAAAGLRRGRPRGEPAPRWSRARCTSSPACSPGASPPTCSGRPTRRCTSGCARRWPPSRAGVVQGAPRRERGPAARGLAAITAHRFFYGLSFVATCCSTPSRARSGWLQRLGQVVVVSVVGGCSPRSSPRGDPRARARSAGIVVVFAAACGRRGGLRPALHARGVPGRRLLPGLRRPGQQDLPRHAAAGVVEDDFRGRVFSFYDTLFTSASCRRRVSACVLPPDGKCYLVIAIIAGGYAVTAPGVRRGARAAGASRPEPVVEAA